MGKLLAKTAPRPPPRFTAGAGFQAGFRSFLCFLWFFGRVSEWYTPELYRFNRRLRMVEPTLGRLLIAALNGAELEPPAALDTVGRMMAGYAMRPYAAAPRARFADAGRVCRAMMNVRTSKDFSTAVTDEASKEKFSQMLDAVTQIFWKSYDAKPPAGVDAESFKSKALGAIQRARDAVLAAQDPDSVRDAIMRLVNTDGLRSVMESAL